MVKEGYNAQNRIEESKSVTGESAKITGTNTGASMGPNRAALNVRQLISYLCKGLNIVGVVLLVIMTFLTVADVIGRYVFRYPIMGSTEITEYMLVSIVFLCLGWCAIQGKMVVVDLVTTHFPKRVQAILNCITLLIGFGVIVVITWQSSLETMALKDLGKASSILKIPAYPFMWILTGGFAVLCLVMVVQIVQNILRIVRYES